MSVVKANSSPLILGFLGSSRNKKDHKPFSPILSRIGGFPTTWKEFSILSDALPPRCSRCRRAMSLLLQVDTSYSDIERVVLLFVCLNAPRVQNGQPNEVAHNFDVLVPPDFCHTQSEGWRVFRMSRRLSKADILIKDIATFTGSTTVLPEAATFEAAIFQAGEALIGERCNSNQEAKTDKALIDNNNPESKGNDNFVGAKNTDLDLKENGFKWMYVNADIPCLPIHELEVEKGDKSLEESALMDELTLYSRELAENFNKVSDSDEALKEVKNLDSAGKLESDYENTGDPITLKMEKRLSLVPEQIVRYSLNSRPLWIATPAPNSKLADVILGSGGSIPLCSHCGRRRIFEMQALSSLTTLLGQRHKSTEIVPMFWGTCVVYSCREDCWPDDQRDFLFAEEVAIVQSI
eukprot:Gregarina_sp_Poly_1__1730@NODE_1446_length_4130_cov_51_014029_g958_i0_p1_GENE_NODE_1446_length_4130_cov_51_014029_g958_i0NODE_1446_length_4130_cov_51_014029_g958_i0_p1_ORF_typecomplete_len408_score47_14PDCD2_C/PF04194_13/3_5e02PDCD2_C/PF04194_13/1_8e29zfSec23_Sec24/PF04810_15/0_24zfSec23_Sec24/PF04810_15/5_6e03_NODE_1446_length_4130_cov_51_014029_g958_i025973820